MVAKGESVSHSVMSNSLQPHELQPIRLLCPWNSPGKNTRVGSRSLLQGIFLTQGSNLGLLHCRQILYRLSHQGNLRGGSQIINNKQFYNWRKIALQCYIGFCCITKQISHNYTYIPSPLSLPLLPQPHPLRSSQSTSWVPCVI